MNTIKEIQSINEQELSRGLAGTPASWHAKYANAAWVYVGNLDLALTEGDVLAVMSQYGEIEDLHLVRDTTQNEDGSGGTGKSKGFAFVKYCDARSCVLAVDNLVGIKLVGRSLRIDHVENYRLPKNLQEKEEQVLQQLGPGQAYEGQELANEYSLERGQDLFAPPPPPSKETSNDNEKRPEETAAEKAARRTRKQELRMLREEKREAKQAKRARKLERMERRQEKEERRRRKNEKKKKRERENDDNSSSREHDRHRRHKRQKDETRKADRHHHHRSSKRAKRTKTEVASPDSSSS